MSLAARYIFVFFVLCKILLLQSFFNSASFRRSSELSPGFVQWRTAKRKTSTMKIGYFKFDMTMTEIPRVLRTTATRLVRTTMTYYVLSFLRPTRNPYFSKRIKCWSCCSIRYVYYYSYYCGVLPHLVLVRYGLVRLSG